MEDFTERGALPVILIFFLRKIPTHSMGFMIKYQYSNTKYREVKLCQVLHLVPSLP